MSDELPFTQRARFVWVEWDDACDLSLGWVNWGDVKREIHLVVSVGFLVGESPDGIVLASAISEDAHNSHFSIPRGTVLRIHDIPLPTLPPE